MDYMSSQPQTPQIHIHSRNVEYSSLPRAAMASSGRGGGQRAAVIMTTSAAGAPMAQQQRYRTFQSSRLVNAKVGISRRPQNVIICRRNSGTSSYIQVPKPDADIVTRPSSSLSSTATVRATRQTSRTNKHQRAAEIEDFPLEAIPAPPAQFNTASNGADDEQVSLVGHHAASALVGSENVALIRSPALKAAVGSSNGHATLMR